MPYVNTLFGVTHTAVLKAKCSDSTSSNVLHVYVKEQHNVFSVGVCSNATKRYRTLEKYDDHDAAQEAATALANHYGVGVEQ